MHDENTKANSGPTNKPTNNPGDNANALANAIVLAEIQADMRWSIRSMDALVLRLGVAERLLAADTSAKADEVRRVLGVSQGAQDRRTSEALERSKAASAEVLVKLEAIAQVATDARDKSIEARDTAKRLLWVVLGLLGVSITAVGVLLKSVLDLVAAVGVK